MIGRREIILADPAWRYKNRTPRGAAENHYATMTVERICRIPVAQIAAPDAALFLWATWPLLPDALRVIEAWGFVYKTCAFAWVKTTKAGNPAMGLGKWTRGNTEPCLLATRGRPERIDMGVPQVILDETFTEETLFAPRAEHSAKPPEARDRIVRLLGDRPRLELFAREHTPGWAAWGNDPRLQIPDSQKVAR